MKEGDDRAVELRVDEVVAQTHDTRSIVLDNAEGRIIPGRAGQHVKVCVATSAGPAWRSFTLSSPPTRPGRLEITVKRKREGLVSNALHALEPGEYLKVKGPSGRLAFDPGAETGPLVLAVAGTGVTPALAILRTLADADPARVVALLYGCRTREDIIFARELEDLQIRLPFLRVAITLSRPDPSWTGPAGRIGPDFLSRSVNDLATAHHVLCGPGTFGCDLAGWLASQGVPSERIHVELFSKTAKGIA